MRCSHRWCFVRSVSNHIQFSHFSIASGKRAGIGIDSPQEIHRSHFESIGVNGSRTAGIRAAGFINTFSNCMLRANNDAIGLFLSTWPTEGSLWNNQVNVINCNLEWNRIGIVVANGDEVRITGNNIEGCLGPAIMVSGVWGLTISSNYMEDNNLKVPAYNIGGHYTTVIGDIILTGTGTTTNRPWMLPYTNDPASKDYSCTDAAINASECVVPILRYDLLGVSGAEISGNTFVTGDAAINQLNYAAVVLAHADGVAINNNHMVSQRHLPPFFPATFRPFCAVFSPFFRGFRLPGAKTERMGDELRKMGEIWGRNGRETAVT